jgi:DNA-directed RNA polymerase subunit F
MKLSQLVENNQTFNSKSFKDLSPVMKEAVNDVMKLIKNEGNLIFDFNNTIEKVAKFHNVDKDDIEEYFDREIVEQLGE